MTNTDHSNMSDEELKQYFLANKYDQSALQAYLARQNSKSKEVITTVGDTDFDLKIEQAIQAKIKNTTKNKQKVMTNDEKPNISEELVAEAEKQNIYLLL